IAWPGVITAAALAPANEADLAVAPQLLAGLAGWALGDKGYWSPALCAELAAGGLDLIAPPRGKNAGVKRWPARLVQTRRRIETVLSQLAERYHAKPVQAQRRLLQEIPGVDALVAVTIIAEAGVDMSVFGNAKRLAAWAGVCPGNHQSAGKRRSGATRRGNVHLKTALVTAAVSGSRR